MSKINAKHIMMYMLIVVVFVAVLGSLISLFVNNGNADKSINSYKDCVDAGYPILESYPEQCSTPDGKRFTNPDAKIILPNE